MTPKLSHEDLTGMLTQSPFHQLLGLRLLSTDADTQTLELEMPFVAAVERIPGGGQYHGGILASLIDIAGDFALIWALGFGVPTINFRTDYLRPAFNSSLRASARIRKIGRTVGVVDIDVFDEQQRLVAIGRGCYGTSSG
jgi:uncharacterized protein (TIGR00369 family)